MFERLGSATFRFRFAILIAWVIAAIFFATMAPDLAGQGSSDQTTFLPQNSPSRVAKDALERAFPGSTSASSATITMDRPGGLTDADRAWRDAFAAWSTSEDAPEQLRNAVTDTLTADSRPELEELFRAEDGTFELFNINLNVADAGDEATEVVAQLREHMAATLPAGLEAHVSGAAAISSDYLSAVQAGTDSTTTVTIILVILVLLAIYRAPLAALIPLITIGVAFVASKGVLGFLAQAGWQVSSTLETFLVVMVFGVGTDYAIFLISRYREEVSHDGDWHDAAKVTVKRIGAVITASAGTVIVGMMAMGVGDFKMITSMGPGIAIAVAVTLLAALTLSPALLSIFGHYLFWPLHTREKHEGEPRGFFASLAGVVTRHPMITTIGMTALLLVPVLYLPQVKSNFDVLADLPATADSRIGYQQIGDHLGEDKLVQSTALIDLGGDGDILAPAQLAKLHALMVTLQDSGSIATTTSLVTPEGDTVVPDGFRPSATLKDIADGFSGDDGEKQSTESADLLDPEVEDGLNQALDYLNSLAVAFPDVAAGAAMRDAQAGMADAIDVIDRVQEQSVVTTQLRNLSASITDPANTATSTGDSDSESDANDTLMSDYLAELAASFPEVKTLDAWKDAVRAAASLEKDASITAALDLSNAFGRLADDFEGTDPDATMTPESLANTTAAKEFKKEATETFDALPGLFTAASEAFAGRPDDFFLPTNLTGEDAEDLQKAIDAFVSEDHTATRFYITSSSSAYSTDAFQAIRDARTLLTDSAGAFGSAASGHIGGPSAQFADVQDTLAADFVKVGAITVLGILLVLMLLLRALVAPLYLVATVLVSYGSTLGLSGYLFMEVLGQEGISPYLPLMVFVLLVALGSDYNIFLMHRVREENETRPMRDAVRIASGHTGAVITSAGLILAGTFGSMATAPLTILFQVGVAVAIGVLIDTFLVRSILVPAITALVGDWAWWPSGSRFAAALGGAPVPVPVPVGAGTGVPVGAAAAVGTGAAVLGTGAAAGAAAATTATWSPTGEALIVEDPAAVSVAAERGRSRRRLAIGIALVVMIPLMVAGLLTWSMGGAMDNISGVKAAVVNHDQGGSMTLPDGTVTELALGDDLAATLVKPSDSGFAWVEVSADEADAGLVDGTYAAVLTIPEDFSRSVAAIRSDTTGTAAQAGLGLATDDASSYALGTVARAVSAAIATSTAQGVTASYVDDVLLAVTDAQARLTDAAGTAGDLSASSSSLADDASGVKVFAGQLVDGLQQLVDGTSDTSQFTQLVDGTQAVADGVEKIADGQDELAKGTKAAASGAQALAKGADQVADGADQLATQTSSLPAQVNALAKGANDLAAGAHGLAGGIAAYLNGDTSTTPAWPGLKDLASTAGALSNKATTAKDDAITSVTKAGNVAQAAGGVAQDAGTLAGGLAGLASLCDGTYGSGDTICQGIAAMAGDAGTLAADAGSLANSAGNAASAAQDVVVGTATVEGYAQGVDQLAAGAVQYAQGLHSGANDLADGLDQYAAGVDTFAAQAPALADGISKLSTGTAGIASGASDLADGLDTLATGSARMATGAAKAADGAQALAKGVSKANGGLSDLTDAADLALEAGQLVEAQAGDIADNGNTLSDDAQALKDDLDTSAAGVGTYGSEQRTKLSSLAANPIAVDATRVNAASGAADGMAPFLMALAAWVGVMGAFLVLPAIWASDRRRWVRGVLVGFTVAALVGVLAALVMVAGMIGLVGLTVASVPALIMFAVLSTLAFTAIVQSLVALFGSRGWLLALLLLVLQVAAVGFPVAVIPGPIAALHPFLPMSYAVDAMRGAILGAGSTPAIDAFALTAFLVVSLLITLAAAAGPAMRREQAGTDAEAGAAA